MTRVAAANDVSILLYTSIKLYAQTQKYNMNKSNN